MIMISDDTRAGRRYHHNGDFSGEVWIVMSPDEVDKDHFAGEAFFTVKIPTQDLRDIVAQAASCDVSAFSLPVGSVIAGAGTVYIKRYDRRDEDEYWMPAEGYPLPQTNAQMQDKIDRGDFMVLRSGPES